MQSTDNRGRPWYPYEKLELLTEIIKAANVAPELLLDLVRSLPSPDFREIPLPRGRTLRQCETIYQEMLIGETHTQRGARYHEVIRPYPEPLRDHMLQQGLSPAPPIPGLAPPTLAHLPPHLAALPPAGGRYQQIQPRPPGLGNILNPPSPEEPQRKKRGRPPKAETEMRREAAHARGEIYPPPKRRSLATSSLSQSSGPPSAGPSLAATQAARAVMTPDPPPESKAPSVSSSGKRRRKKPTTTRTDTEGRTSDDEPNFVGPQEPSPTRPYPDILSRDPEGGPSTFRAPHRGD